MTHKFQKHYTREEARALLPEVRKWLGQLQQQHERFTQLEDRVKQLQNKADDVGGDAVNNWIRALVQIKRSFGEFARREIQVKDVERGLVDFPAIIGGREVFLCWEQDEDDIEFWHDLDTGYAGRERLK